MERGTHKLPGGPGLLPGGPGLTKLKGARTLTTTLFLLEPLPLVSAMEGSGVGCGGLRRRRRQGPAA